MPPLKFEPILKSVVWGGEKIIPFKGLSSDQKNVGESWEISGVKGNESIVANGPDKGMSLTGMIEKYGSLLVGEKNYAKFGDMFPLLIKIIDAAGDLSIQVHPDDNLAKERHNSLGKTEMWYIVDSEEGAKICSGLAETLTPDTYVEKVANKTIMESIACHESHPGDVFFLPAGRIHAIGAGNLLVEVQENSDITYRIYDYDRLDSKTGLPRQLHTEEAKDAIDYKVYPSYITKPNNLPEGAKELVKCNHFSVFLIELDGKRTYFRSHKSFSSITCIEGEMRITDDRDNSVTVKQGESVLIPAMATKISLSGKAKFIDAYC
ncbi:MAG: mannose-6-phosphate isomerase [Paramuribaculum sp.]|nr:mannose-6-phosphate isomerase [Paramuribaculum sp.]